MVLFSQFLGSLFKFGVKGLDGCFETIRSITLHAEVELDLRLGARRTNRNLRTALSEELQHVALGQRDGRDLSSQHILGFLEFVVAGLDDLIASYDGGRGGAELGHQSLDLLSATDAFLGQRDELLLIETKLFVDVHEQLVEGLALFGSPCSGFGNHARGDDGILVADEVASQVAVAFLTAADELLLAFEFKDLVGDVFDTGTSAPGTTSGA